MPVSASIATVYPEPCPAPVSFTVESCRDAMTVDAGDVLLSGLGRIVQVDAVVKNVCPGKQVAVAVLLSEVAADGTEHPRGCKTILIPPQDGTACQDVTLRCIPFVVPEQLSAAGPTDSICAERQFRTRVIANYADTDFVCCAPQDVVV